MYSDLNRGMNKSLAAAAAPELPSGRMEGHEHEKQSFVGLNYNAFLSYANCEQYNLQAIYF